MNDKSGGQAADALMGIFGFKRVDIDSLAAELAERDARIAELEAERSDPEFPPKYARRLIEQLRTELAAIKAQNPVAFVHPQQLKALAKSAESTATCTVWNKPDATPSGTSLRVPLYAAPVAMQVVMPERKDMTRGFDAQRTFAMGWNAYADEYTRLNAADQGGAQDE